MTAVIADVNFFLRMTTKHLEPIHLGVPAFAEKVEQKGIFPEVHPMHAAGTIYTLDGLICGISLGEAKSSPAQRPPLCPMQGGRPFCSHRGIPR